MTICVLCLFLAVPCVGLRSVIMVSTDNTHFAKYHYKIMYLHQQHRPIHSLHSQTLANVQSTKYLDITITDGMALGQHISEISS